MGAPITLGIEGLTIHYGRHKAVRELSLHVRAGEIYGLLGPNGSGKSSTIAAIASTLKPTAGRITLEGITHAQDPTAYLSGLGFVPRNMALYEELTVGDNLSFFGRLYDLPRKTIQQRLAKVLELTDLRAGDKVHTLSGGMQRRVNLGCALMHEPKLLLLDEPTVGLDITSRNLIFDNLRALRDQGCAMIFTTHHLEEVELLCDRIGVMKQGKLVAEGTLDQLHQQSSATRVTVANPSRLEHVFLELTRAGLPQTTSRS